MTAEPVRTETSGNASVKVVETAVETVTEYVILERDDPDGVWSEFARETARSADAAIKVALAGNTDGGTFVAVTVRSWKPVKVTPQTVTTLKLEEAK